jgi:hypothetical protein
VSRSVYGAAIVSILGTSAGIYKESFTGNKYPYEGSWNLATIERDGHPLVDTSIAMAYSEQAETYWGYSEYTPIRDGELPHAQWLRVDSFDPKESILAVTWIDAKGQKVSATFSLEAKHDSKLFETNASSGQTIRLSRPD